MTDPAGATEPTIVGVGVGVMKTKGVAGVATSGRDAGCVVFGVDWF